MQLFQPGEPVVLRHRRNEYRWAAPLRVVEDRGDFVALYLQPGSSYVRMGDESGVPTRDFINSKRLITSTWGEHHALHLVRFGDEHATILLWGEHDWEFKCWYINFQLPLQRRAGGFETMDLTLDLLLSPDLDRWQWKDEDEFVDIGIPGGWYTPEQLAELKAYGRGVIGQAQARARPFNEPWPDWRPDPSWLPLALPAGWDA